MKDYMRKLKQMKAKFWKSILTTWGTLLLVLDTWSQQKMRSFGKPPGTAITAERSRELFARDIQSAIEDCERLYGQWHNWPEEVQRIMVNMCFNLGATRLEKFRQMRFHLSQHNWKQAAEEGRDSKWYRQVTNRAERLMTRLENVA